MRGREGARSGGWCFLPPSTKGALFPAADPVRGRAQGGKSLALGIEGSLWELWAFTA